MRSKIMVLCTGNICRSPMMLAALIDAGYAPGELISRGTDAITGYPPTKLVVDSVKRLARGGDGRLDTIVRTLTNHRATQVTQADVAQCKLIFVAERLHQDYLLSLFEEIPKVVRLGIPDPLGHWFPAYKQCWDSIRTKTDAIKRHTD